MPATPVPPPPAPLPSRAPDLLTDLREWAREKPDAAFLIVRLATIDGGTGVSFKGTRASMADLLDAAVGLLRAVGEHAVTPGIKPRVERRRPRPLTNADVAACTKGDRCCAEVVPAVGVTVRPTNVCFASDCGRPDSEGDA